MCHHVPMRSDPQELAAGAAALTVDGGPVGVLLSHGFTGTPASMTAWGQHLADLGHTVRVPRLPGHGTTWQELNTTRWEDWYAELDTAMDELTARCDHVVVAGLSMGGALALRVAEQRPADVEAIILVNPAINIDNKMLPLVKLLRHVLPSIAGVAGDIKKPDTDEFAYDRTPLKALHSQTLLWKLIRDDLATVTQPLLLFRSPEDHVVDPSSARIIFDGISSTTATEILLEDSYHVATVDNDAMRIFGESAKFIKDHVGPPR